MPGDATASDEGAGWSLVAVDLGDGLVVDRLTVRAPTVLDALEATQAVWSTRPLRCLDAPKGGGKTFALSRVTAAGRVLCLTDRAALTGQIAERFHAELRLPSGSDRYSIRAQANVDRLAVTLHTTPRLDARDMSQDVLVMDEVAHCIDTLARGRELRGLRRGEVARATRSLCGRVREGWLAQASLTPADLRTIAGFLRAAGRPERLFHLVVETPVARGCATEASSREVLRDALLVAAGQGPVFYASASRVACETVAEEMTLAGMDPLVISGRTAQDPRAQAWLADPRPELAPVVLVSPSVVSGLSIDTIGGRPAYPDVFLEFPVWPGGLVLDDALQFVARVRGGPRLRFWAPECRATALNAEEQYGVEERIADASARLLHRAPRSGSALDALAAERRAAGDASLAPSPREALARGLVWRRVHARRSRVGWPATGGRSSPRCPRPRPLRAACGGRPRRNAPGRPT